MRLTELRRTTGFRLATLFLALFGIVSALLFTYLYVEITGFELERIDDWLQREQAELIREATPDLITRFQHQSQYDALRQRPFGLFNASGDRLAGGYPGDRPTIPHFDAPFSLRLAGMPGNPPARCIATRMANAQTALLCQNTRELDHFDEELVHVLISVAILTMVLGLVGAVMVGAGAMRRLDAVTVSIQQIVAGDLSQRLPVHSTRDDLDRLVGVVNGMLDEIERLMHEVKGVCDAIAHDLRTPLTRLIAGLERAQRRASSEAEFRAAIEETIDEAGGILRTFNALLRISEIESGLRRAHFVSVDLSTLAADVFEYYEPAAEEKQVALELRLDAHGPCLIDGDPGLLFEALANLVENAIKFAPTDGHVALTVYRDAGHFGVAVRDDGPGIPPEERDAVLRRFYRSETSRHTPGSGLGLSLVQAVASMHGMTIRFGDTPRGCDIALSKSVR